MSYPERDMTEPSRDPGIEKQPPIDPQVNERYDPVALALNYQKELLALIPDHSPETQRKIQLWAMQLGIYNAESHKKIDEAVRRARQLEEEKAVLERDNALLSELAMKDGLTGLFSRRLLEEDIEQRLAEGKRTGRPVSLLMIDLDRFKVINDEYGHPAGDAVLREISTRLQKALRKHDRVYRYGGEELAALLDTNTPSAVGISERLREQVFEKPVDYINAHGETININVSASIGVGSGDSKLEIIDQADRLLYHAKSTGRNRTAFMAGPDKVGTISGASRSRQTTTVSYPLSGHPPK